MSGPELTRKILSGDYPPPWRILTSDVGRAFSSVDVNAELLQEVRTKLCAFWYQWRAVFSIANKNGSRQPETVVNGVLLGGRRTLVGPYVTEVLESFQVIPSLGGDSNGCCLRGIYARLPLLNEGLVSLGGAFHVGYDIARNLADSLRADVDQAILKTNIWHSCTGNYGVILGTDRGGLFMQMRLRSLILGETGRTAPLALLMSPDCLASMIGFSTLTNGSLEG